METEKLKHLLEAYFSAEATAAQEAELKGMLQAMDMAALAPDIAADARLARTLLTAGGEGVAVNIPPVPEDFAALLCSQADRLERRDSNRKWRKRWIAGGLMTAVAAACVILLFLPAADVVMQQPAGTTSQPAATGIAQGQSTQSVASDTLMQLPNATLTAENGNGKSVKTGKAAGRHYPYDEAEGEHEIEIVEFYDAEAAEAELIAENRAAENAPVVLSMNGRAEAYQTVDQSPEVLDMLNEAFNIISTSGREISRYLRESSNTINNVNP